MIDAQQLRAARNRDDRAAGFPEVGVVGRGPEHWRHWNASGFLKRVGDRECAQCLGQRVDGTPEQTGLLTGSDNDSLPRARQFKSLLRFAGSIERRG